MSVALASYGQAELGFLTEYIGCGFQLGPGGRKGMLFTPGASFSFSSYWAVLFSFVSLFLIVREFMKSVFGDMICRLDDSVLISPAASLP